MTWYQIPILFGASVLAGAVNAVAGGGTLLSFPALILAGLYAAVRQCHEHRCPVARRLSSYWVYRSELGRHRRYVVWLSVPSILGGLAGAWLMVATDEKVFDFLVPYLILMATGLLIVQAPLARLQRRLAGLPAASQVETDADSPAFAHKATPLRWSAVLFSQFLVGVYGGYFGAGIGILMLAAYGILGFTNIHEANAIKNLNAMFINGIAAALFVFCRLVYWPQALLMAVGAIVGGYAGAGRRGLGAEDRPPAGDSHRVGARRVDVFQEDATVGCRGVHRDPPTTLQKPLRRMEFIPSSC